MGLFSSKLKPINASEPFDLQKSIDLLKKNRNKDDIVGFCTSHADKGDKNACFLLGEIYNGIYSIYVNIYDYDATIKYYQKAIEHGATCAYKPLAILYFKGYKEWSSKIKGIGPTK